MTGPAFPVESKYSYRLDARMMTEGLIHNEARVELVYLNASGKVVSVHAGRAIRNSQPWTDVLVGPVSAPVEAVKGQVRFRLEPSSLRDLKGAVGIDEIVVTEMPRMRLQCNSVTGFYSPGMAPELYCTVSGVAERAMAINFRVQDEDGNEITRATAPLEPIRKGELLFKDVNGFERLTDDVEMEAVAKIQLPPMGPGFYRVWASLDGAGELTESVDQTLAVLSPFPIPQGPFGWSLTSDDAKNIPLRVMPEWLAESAVQWIKYPCWFDTEAIAQMDDAARLFGRLEDRSINVVGVICNPPEEARRSLGGRVGDPAAVYLRDTVGWQPLLEPVMNRLTTGVRWWQLGDEMDFSFVNRPRLNETIDEIRTKLQGYGQPIKIVLSWPWNERMVDLQSSTWHAICLGDSVMPSAIEMLAKFRAEDLGEGPFITPRQGRSLKRNSMDVLESVSYPGNSIKRDSMRLGQLPRSTVRGEELANKKAWITLNPLPRSRFRREERVLDLVQKMLAVQQAGIPVAFVSNPFDPEMALVRSDGGPDELLLPWRTTASIIADKVPIGSLELPNGSQNVVLANQTEACLVVWGNEASSEAFYLGPNAVQIDCYGREIPIESTVWRGLEQEQFQVTREPTFIINVDRTVMMWALGVQLDRQRIDSLLGRNQELVVSFENFGQRPIAGSLVVKAPESWGLDDSPKLFTLDGLEAISESMRFVLQNDATVGSNQLCFQFELEGEQNRRFEVLRSVDVGPEDVAIEVFSRLLPDGRLVVRQEITNESQDFQDFDCYSYAPGRLRQRESVRVAPRSTAIVESVWEDGASLEGSVFLLRAEDLRGGRILNVRFVVEL